MKTFTITLTDAEAKALSIVAADPQEWIENVVHNRCRLAIDQIVHAEVELRLSTGEPIPSTKDEIVLGSKLTMSDYNKEEK